MSAQTTNQAQVKGTVSMPWFKFLIGFVAGWCAACFPRLSALMAGGNSVDALSLFSFDYIVLSGVFSVVIGFVVMIMEWNVAREPRATFMMAIGIPALLTGSFNATSGAQQVNAQQEKITDLVVQLSKSEGIAIGEEPLGDFTIIGGNKLGVQGKTDPLQWIGIKAAYAAEQNIAGQGFNPGYKIMEPLFYISLGNAPNKELALNMVKQLKTQVKTATAVKTSKGFTILSRLTPLPKSDAIIEATRLKKQNINVSLIPAKK